WSLVTGAGTRDQGTATALGRLTHLRGRQPYGMVRAEDVVGIDGRLHRLKTTVGEVAEETLAALSLRREVAVRPSCIPRRQRVLPEQRRRLDHGERLATEVLRERRDRRELQETTDRRDLVRHGVDPASPRAQHLGAAFEREEEDAGMDVRDRVERELERGHDA